MAIGRDWKMFGRHHRERLRGIKEEEAQEVQETGDALSFVGSAIDLGTQLYEGSKKEGKRTEFADKQGLVYDKKTKAYYGTEGGREGRQYKLDKSDVDAMMDTGEDVSERVFKGKELRSRYSVDGSALSGVGKDTMEALHQKTVTEDLPAGSRQTEGLSGRYKSFGVDPNKKTGGLQGLTSGQTLMTQDIVSPAKAGFYDENIGTTDYKESYADGEYSSFRGIGIGGASPDFLKDKGTQQTALEDKFSRERKLRRDSDWEGRQQQEVSLHEKVRHEREKQETKDKEFKTRQTNRDIHEAEMMESYDATSKKTLDLPAPTYSEGQLADIQEGVDTYWDKYHTAAEEDISASVQGEYGSADELADTRNIGEKLKDKLFPKSFDRSEQQRQQSAAKYGPHGTFMQGYQAEQEELRVKNLTMNTTVALPEDMSGINKEYQGQQRFLDYRQRLREADIKKTGTSSIENTFPNVEQKINGEADAAFKYTPEAMRNKKPSWQDYVFNKKNLQ